jgi:hypothetical protein
VDTYAAYAFRGRVVRFSPTGRLRDYSLFLAYSAGVIRTADQERIPIEELAARLQTGGSRWGLVVRLTGSDERDLVFEVATAG